MSYPAIEDLLPLRPPALLLDGVIHADADSAVFRARVPGTSPLARGGEVPAFAALEACAQGAGAHQQLVQHAACGHAASPGYLVLVIEARFLQPSFPADTVLRIRVSREGVAPPLALYRFGLEVGGEVLAEGVLGTYVPEPPHEGHSRRQQNH